MTASQRPADVFFLSYPRTLSNLLVKLLSEQTGWDSSGYYLHDAHSKLVRLELDHHSQEYVDETFEEYRLLLRDGFQKLLAARESAHEKGHALFLKSHLSQIHSPTMFFNSIKDKPYASNIVLGSEPQSASECSHPSSPRTNPTMLTDEMLLSFVPVFIIRHPALAVDSLYRAWGDKAPASDMGKLRGVDMTRNLYTWYLEAAAAAAAAAAMANGDTEKDKDLGPGSKGFPLIIDADDVVEGDTVARLAAAIGMDPAQILQSWTPRSTTDMEPIKKRFARDIYESTHIDPSKTSRGLDLDAKFRSWDELYGVEDGAELAKLTMTYMDDYMWLKSRKF